MFRHLLLAACLLAASARLQGGSPFTTGQLFDAQALLPPAVEVPLAARDGKPEWSFDGSDRGNLTFFSGGLEKLKVGPARSVQFTLGKEGALLGWGNYEGKQPPAQRVNLPVGPMMVKVTLRASAPGTLTFLPWCDGMAGGKVAEGKATRKANRKREKPEGVTTKLSGGAEWQTVAFKMDNVKSADGFELEFEGPESATVEVKSVRIAQEMHEGWFRREVALPPGKIWRAVGEVGMMCSLFVNGREVPSANGMLVRPSLNFARGEMFDCEALDLAPLLRAGPNAVALHVARPGAAPYVYFTLTVIMESGEIIRLATDGSWKYAKGELLAEGAKLSTPGLDDRAWKPADSHPGSALNYKRPTARPAYAGLMLLESPDDPYLFFRDAVPVELRIKVPPGVAAPQIAWEVQRFAEGKLAAFKSGEAVGGLAKLGELPRGVYTLAAKLTSGARLLESRIPEPFVVVGKLPMREVAGDTLTDGLDLALEAEIDYTKPEGAIPWQEAGGEKGSGLLVKKAAITTRNGLKYRETGMERGALISHRYEFRQPGDFYLMELEFPDDAERWFGVSCTSSTSPQTSKDGPATWTGQKYPLTGKMQTMSWICRPDPGATAITLSNLQRGSTAAASRLRISHLHGVLPALKFADAGARLIGQCTERTSTLGGFGKTFGFFPEAEPDDQKRMGLTPRDNDPILAMCRALAHDLDAAEHYTQWLRFTGQNLHVMGCLQYFESNTGFIAPAGAADSRLLPDARDTAVRVFRENGIKVIASLEYVCSTTLIREYPLNDGQVALGADTPYLIDKDGRQPWNWMGRYGLNFLHPRVEASMTQIARDLHRKFAGQPNLLGVNFTAYLGGDFLPSFTTQGWRDPLASSFDDVTIARFSKETGVNVAGAAGDPQRFAQRAQFLLAPATKEKWLQWRSEKTRDFFTRMQRVLAAEKLASAHSFVSLYVDVQHAQEAQASGLPVHDYLRRWGWSPEVFARQPGMWFPKWTHATQRYTSLIKTPRNETWPAAWAMSVDDEYNRAFDQPANRATYVMHHWQEHETYAETLEPRDGWPRPFQMTYQAQANGDNARELFTQALATTDPELVMWGFSDLVMMTGHEQPLREFARTLRALPKAKLLPALGTSLQTNLVLREVRDGGRLWFIAANPGYWPLRAEVTVSGTLVRDAVSGQPAGARGRLALALKPYEIRAFVVDDPAAKLISWKAEPVGAADLAHLQGVLADAEAILADRSRAARLLAAEREFMGKQIAAIKGALDRREVALAWSLVTDPRFWTDARTRLTPMRP
jgi:hypothetical protein